jgi:hypothetical protein
MAANSPQAKRGNKFFAVSTAFRGEQSAKARQFDAGNKTYSYISTGTGATAFDNNFLISKGYINYPTL